MNQENAGKETYFVTKRNEEGEDVKIYSLSYDEEGAFKVFDRAIKEQVKERDLLGEKFHWKVLKLFESESGRQIAQES